MVVPNKILEKMLERLLAGLVNGPSLNCRPYASRQRLDLVQLGKLADVTPENVLQALLGPTHEASIKARAPMPKGHGEKSAKAQKLKVAVSIEAADENGIPLADGPIEETADQSNASPERFWLEQQAVLNKLHTIAEDARTYEQDTGVSVLNVGFPLLSLPPGAFGGGKSSASKRVLAPLAFIPVAITVKRGAGSGVDLACKGEGVDLVMPNAALLAWLEQQTGKPVHELDADDEGKHSWREICDIVRSVCTALDVKTPEAFDLPPVATAGEAGNSNALPTEGTIGGADESHLSAVAPDDPSPHVEHTSKPPAEHETGHVDPAGKKAADPRPLTDLLPADVALEPAPKTDALDDAPRILCSAVLGLFPMANQGLLRDTQMMIATETLTGPVESFIRREAGLEIPTAAHNAMPKASAVESAVISPSETALLAPPVAAEKPIEVVGSRPADQPRQVVISEERFISGSDPCQARAVRMAREYRGLVVHGPPGTGKSQTITNIIGDHLARGQRVLVVCDKRTALDVVFNRLRHMGMGNLCALVHDPRRDQRELYKSIRQQLDELPEAASDPKADTRLQKVDRELQELHDELTRYRDALVRRQGEYGLNFGEAVGQWLSLAGCEAQGVCVDGVTLQTLETYSNAVTEILARGHLISHGVNPWVGAAGISLGDFLAQPMSKIRALARSCDDAARAADETMDPLIPPFAPAVPLKAQVEARAHLANVLPKVLATADGGIVARWAHEEIEAMTDALRKLDAAEAFSKSLKEGALDAELLANLGDRPLEALPIGEHLTKLAAHHEFAEKWYAFLPLRAKSEAAGVVNGYGLTLSKDNADRVGKFLVALRARLELSKVLRSFDAGAQRGKLANAGTVPSVVSASAEEPGLPSSGLIADEVIERALKGHRTVVDLMTVVRTNPGYAGLVNQIADVLATKADVRAFIEGVAKSAPRGAALEKLEETATASRLFESDWLAKNCAAFRAGQASGAVFSSLSAQVETLEGVVRVRQGLNMLPLKLRAGVEALLQASVAPPQAMNILRREALAAEIAGRLKSDPHLQEIDGHRLEMAFSRYRELDESKRNLTRDVIRHHWVSRQQDRLLAQTRSRLNTTGADLRRRLMLRGERAMRLRQVVAVGGKIEGGDPLFDFCPIWLCSPETVAQVFPCQPVFDVLVFDEASQMRLEESLPVLMRGRRIVIAGDPRQLPPTRFFESAVAASDDDDADTDQALFEQHQGEIEDLLTAALGLDIQQCYLDVHYRSRHADLIAFSNEHFYNSRLQPIPGRPSRGLLEHSVVLDHVGGVYERRRNEVEADRIVQIVGELLARDEPPSIGIACFNLVQRDLVAEKLDELAAEDSTFARRLEAARARQGEGSFEGLFVKNLENVQGDERDYILISTTYGPGADGKFHRRFGPLGQPGGGRRLNVLVTRAREKVHVVTSVPREAYHALPELESGQTPGGAWLLLAYLKYAEQVGGGINAFAGNGDAQLAAPQSQHEVQTTGGQTVNAFDQPAVSNGAAETALSMPEDQSLAQSPIPLAAEVAPKPALSDSVNILPSKSPSLFAEALARRLSHEHGIGSDVHWGNEGFCVDLALHNSGEPADVPIGILCDAARYAAADDPMQWDIFRAGILEAQGWKLHRVWTPHFFRDPEGVIDAVVADSPVKELDVN